MRCASFGSYDVKDAFSFRGKSEVMDFSWKTERLVEWATRERPAWAHSVIRNWNDVFPRGGTADILTFVTSERRCVADVDMDKLVGQWEHHAGHTWLEALVKDPCHAHGRLKANLSQFEDDSSAYFDGRITACGGITFVALNGGPLYSDEGTHRSIIAKFALEMARQRTGKKYILRGVPQVMWVADCVTRDIYLELYDFVRSRSIALHCSLSSYRSSKTEADLAAGPSFWVQDSRFGRDWPLHGRLSAAQFRAFAGSLLTNNACIDRRARIQHLWRRIRGSHKLIMASDPRTE